MSTNDNVNDRYTVTETFHTVKQMMLRLEVPNTEPLTVCGGTANCVQEV